MAQRGEGCPVFLKAVFPVFGLVVQQDALLLEDPHSNARIGKQPLR